MQKASTFKGAPCKACGSCVRYNHLDKPRCVACRTKQARARYRKPLSPELREKAMALLRMGWTPYRIAQRLKRSAITVYAALNEAAQ